MPHPTAFIIGLVLTMVVLWDTFETMILPRRVTRRIRVTSLFYRATWRPWGALARRIRAPKRREAILSYYGPLSLVLLLAFWVGLLILGFGLLHWGVGSTRTDSLLTDTYLSGTSFFTLGIGDVTPNTPAGRWLTMLESGMGFGFLAVVIGYLPVLYQAFSRREVTISLLDARAGSPPSAGLLLQRHAGDGGIDALRALLREWERWSAELMESHLSYPVLSFFRSQHDNQSWIASLTTILDTCSLAVVGIDGACARQAQLTFAIARHAVVDLAQVMHRAPVQPAQDRLPAEELVALRTDLAAHGLVLRDGAEADAKLKKMRSMYEPYVHALSQMLQLPLPRWVPEGIIRDNWRTSAWGRSSGLTGLPEPVAQDDHT